MRIRMQRGWRRIWRRLCCPSVMAGRVPAIYPPLSKRKWPGLPPGHEGERRPCTASPPTVIPCPTENFQQDRIGYHDDLHRQVRGAKLPDGGGIVVAQVTNPDRTVDSNHCSHGA